MIQVEKCSMRGKDVGKAMWQDMTTEQNIITAADVQNFHQDDRDNDLFETHCQLSPIDLTRKILFRRLT